MAYYITDEKTTFYRTIIALLKCPITLVSVYKKSISPTSNKNLKYISWKKAKKWPQYYRAKYCDAHKAKLPFQKYDFSGHR